MQFSQTGLQTLSPQVETQTPAEQVCVQGAQPQSAGHVEQFSPHDASHIPFPQLLLQTFVLVIVQTTKVAMVLIEI